MGEETLKTEMESFEIIKLKGLDCLVMVWI
jgi:hypothetical protein